MKKSESRPALRLAGRTLAVAAVIVAALLYLGEGKDTFHRTFAHLALQRLALVAFAGFLLLASASMGAAVARALRIAPEWKLSFFLEATGLGLGIFALVFLLLGVLGIFHRAVWLGAMVLGAFAGAPLWTQARASARQSVEAPVQWISCLLLALAAFPVLLILFVGFHPPLDYDVQEYHLGAPATWLRLGQVSFLPNNAYSSFPSNTEMLFELALVLFNTDATGHDLYWGSYGAIAIAALAGVLVALTAFDIARRLGGTFAGALAGVFFYTCPWTFELSIKAYVELPLIFFGLLASDHALRAVLAGTDTTRRRDILLAGIFTGIAMGTKYTAWLYFAAPLGAFLLVSAILGKLPVRQVIVFALAAGLVVSPWLARNLVNTGNPVWPLLAGVLPSGPWSQLQAARWNAAHAAHGFSLTHFVERFGQVLFRDENVSLAAFVFAPLALLVARARRMSGAFLLLALVIFLGWFGLTHRMLRFFFPAVPFLCIASGIGCAGIAQKELRRVAAAVAIVLVATGLLQTYVLVAGLHAEIFPDGFPELDLSKPEAYENERTLPEKAVYEFAWERGSPSSRFLFLGEAKFFYLGPYVEARTVFDSNVIDELAAAGSASDEELVTALKSRRFRYIFVNWPEIDRFNRDYAFQFQGERQAGYSARITRALFARWEEKTLVERVKIEGLQRDDAYVVYAIR
ncbi:MAG: glycosyltransferase family 39 protein [Planctomycetota bacterium]